MAAILTVQPGSTLRRRTRRDALPEGYQYRDDGCEVAPACLECPLERCRHEEPNGLLTVRLRARNPQIVASRRDGETVDEIADRYSLSRRTVFRVLAEA